MKFFVCLSIFCAIPSILAAPAAIAASCALCPSTNLANEVLVANSGGTLGVPRFCGYQATAGTPISPTTICFYSNNGALSFSSNGLCLGTTELYSPCTVVT